MQLSLNPDQKDRSHNLSAQPTTSIAEFMTRTTKRIVLFWLFGFGPSDVVFFPLLTTEQSQSSAEVIRTRARSSARLPHNTESADTCSTASSLLGAARLVF